MPISVYLAWVFGLGVGGFLTTVIHRLPRIVSNGGRGYSAGSYGLIAPGPACTNCGRALVWYDNVPLLSVLLLRGKCRWCFQTIPLKNVAIELTTGGLAAAAVWRFGPDAQAIGAFTFCAALLVLGFIDAESCLLPNSITLPLLLLGLFANSFHFLVSFRESTEAAVLGVALPYTAFLIFRRRERTIGIGAGDLKLLAAVGAWLGLYGLLWTCALTLAASSAWAAYRLFGPHRPQAEGAFPLGPFVALGAFATLASMGSAFRV